MDEEWFEIGYNDQCWGYPALDHVWGTKNFPLDKKVILSLKIQIMLSLPSSKNSDTEPQSLI